MKHESRPAREFRRQRGRLSTIARVATVGALAAGALVVATGTASAAALTGVNWGVDNNATSATGVTYTWTFTTASAGTIASVTMTVPADTAGAALTDDGNFGLGPGTVTLAGDTVTYAVTTPVAVPANTPISLQIGGFTNTATASPPAPSPTSTVTTRDGTAATIDNGDSNAVDFGDSNTVVTVVLGRSLVFTNDTPAFTLAPIPGSPAGPVASKTVTLTVQTNAIGGYTLAAQLTPGAPFVPEADTGGVPVLPVDQFAAVAGLTATGGSGATLTAPYTAGRFVGYDPTTPQTIVTATGPTGATVDTLTLTNQIKVDFNQASQVYTGNIHYTVTPNFNLT